MIKTFGLEKEYNSSDLNKILFIGNDGRDYDLVFDIAKTMKDKNFVFLSRNLPEETSKLHNVELYIGDWNSNIFSDEFLRNIYEQSVLSIIPVKKFDTTIRAKRWPAINDDGGASNDN